MTTLASAVLAALGVHYVYTAIVFGWRGAGIGAPSTGARRTLEERFREWATQAGLGDTNPRELLAASIGSGLVGFLAVAALFGAVVPGLAVGCCLATLPSAAARVRRNERRAVAAEAWPRLLEELRVLTQSLGRSIPHALFEVGRRGPAEMQLAFARAEREWVLTTDFDRSLVVLKEQLADPTADAACETLLVAHRTGGSDLDARLEALIEDRIEDVRGRKDARARQAGARFARRFVVLVPAGMALAGMSVGDGRSAYASATGQLGALVAIAMMVACWWWAGRMLRLPDDERVFR